MDIKQNTDGSCYINECLELGSCLAIDVLVTECDDDGDKRWDVMVCQSHAEEVFQLMGIELVDLGIVVILEES